MEEEEENKQTQKKIIVKKMAILGDVAVGRDGVRFVIAKLTAIKAPEAAKDFDTYRGLAQSLRTMIGSDILQQYNIALRASHGVSINNALLEQIFAGDNRYPGH